MTNGFSDPEHPENLKIVQLIKMQLGESLAAASKEDDVNFCSAHTRCQLHANVRAWFESIDFTQPRLRGAEALGGDVQASFCFQTWQLGPPPVSWSRRAANIGALVRQVWRQMTQDGEEVPSPWLPSYKGWGDYPCISCQGQLCDMSHSTASLRKQTAHWRGAV